MKGFTNNSAANWRTVLLATVGATALFAGGALAQDNGGAAASDSQSDDKIVVTGSRIARDGFETPTPVTVLGAEEIELSGAVSLGELLNELPSLGSTFSLANSSRFIGTAGANFLDLRNMGTSRTLVLVDGRRHVSSDSGSARVDINTIPADLVERVEIITGGASAIYGADAVTGVVNFVLKKDFEGFNVRTQYNSAESGAFDSWFVSGTGGGQFDSGRGSAAVSFEYTTQSALHGRDSDESFTRMVRTIVNTPDVAAFYGLDPQYDEVTVPDASLWFINRSGVYIGSDIYTFDEGGIPRLSDAQDRVPGNACFNCTDGLDFGDVSFLQPEQERISLNAFFDYELTDSAEFFFEGKYVDTQTTSLGQPAFDQGTVRLYRDSPYASAEAIALMDAEVTNSLRLYRFNIDAGLRGEDNERQTHRFVTGFRGDFEGLNGNSWDYELSYVYGRSQRTLLARNNRINDRWLAATDAVYASVLGAADLDGVEAGDIICRVQEQQETGLDPILPTGAAAPQFAIDGCVPTPFLGPNAVTAESAAWFNTNSVRTDAVEQEVLSGFVTGDLFQLPAGPLGFAVGAEHRKERSVSFPASIDTLGVTFGNELSPEKGEFDVSEVFGEVTVPLLSHVPLAESLTVDAAVRWADYSTIGTATSWKVGGEWQPIEDIRFRATYSEAIRAPNISELFGPLDQNFFGVDDPCSESEIDALESDTDAGNQAKGALHRANCTALGRPANYESVTDQATIPGLSGGNADLSEEASTSITAGVIVRPRFLPGFAASVDYWDMEIENAISYVSAQDTLDRCVEGTSIDNIFCDNLSRDPGTFELTQIISSALNVSSLEASGVDFEVSYSFDVPSLFFGANADNGSMRVRFLGTYLEDLTEFPFQTEPDNGDPEKGELGMPEWAYNISATWDRGPLTINYDMRYLDEMLRSEVEDYEADPFILYPATAEMTIYHDIQVRYLARDNIEVYVGVDNFTDELPPYPSSGTGGGSGIYDNLGRQIYVGVSGRF